MASNYKIKKSTAFVSNLNASLGIRDQHQIRQLALKPSKRKEMKPINVTDTEKKRFFMFYKETKSISKAAELAEISYTAGWQLAGELEPKNKD
jgi:hypothetical protein